MVGGVGTEAAIRFAKYNFSEIALREEEIRFNMTRQAVRDQNRHCLTKKEILPRNLH